MAARLFEPIVIGRTSLLNRIVVSPMCQYSADDGSPGDWHLAHLTQLAMSGAGLVMVEATAVERAGRITHGCLGLYSDSNEAHLGRVLAAARSVAPEGTRFGIQLAHAGRKASTRLPWRGGKPLESEEDPWSTLSASPLPFDVGWPTPAALTEAGLARVVAAFTLAARRAVRLGFDVIELHFAYGYLGHQFLSRLANHREDAYGGTADDRRRFPLRVARAVQEALPVDVALGARISATDWVDGGEDVEDAVTFASELRALGVAYVCVASGGVVPANIPFAPGFQAPLSARVRAGASIVTRVSGLIADPEQAERLVAAGQADLIALARAFLDDPRWVWHAADRLGAEVAIPPPYQRSQARVWPGARLSRPRDFPTTVEEGPR